MLKGAGADVDPASRRVRFDPAFVESRIGLAPTEFVLHSRNPARNLTIGGRHVAFGSVASAPNSFDRAGGRRPGNRRDYQNFIRLGQSFDSIHFWGGYPVEPIDIHASVRHLDALFDLLTLSDKPIHAYSLGRERNLDAIEMVKIARGIDDETLEREPSLFTVINSSSPLRLDTPMLEGVIQMARRNQVVVLTPFTLAGAMAPVTLAGALVEQHAEALAGLVMTQVVRPGAPFVYGGFTSNVDMKSGAPAFGTPEYMKTAIVGGQLARRLALPYRSSNTNAANTLDAQAAYESVFSLWGAIMGGVNFLMHGAGWMEGGLQASFEKMALDADLLAMVAEFLRPLRVDEAELALEAMREVGPGGHFFGAEHTQSRYRTAFFPPMISDWRNYESWREAGSPTAFDAAERIVAERLRDFVAPPLEVRAPRGAGGLRRPPQGGRRRADRLLSAIPPVRGSRAGAPLHAAVAAVFFAFGVGVGLWGGASGAILTRAGVDAATFGIILTVYTGAYLIAMSAGGALAHRFGVERVLPVTAIIFGAALCGLLNAASEVWVAIALIIAGFVGGVVDVLHERRGRADRTAARPPDPCPAARRSIGWHGARRNSWQLDRSRRNALGRRCSRRARARRSGRRVRSRGSRRPSRAVAGRDVAAERIVIRSGFDRARRRHRRFDCGGIGGFAVVDVAVARRSADLPRSPGSARRSSPPARRRFASTPTRFALGSAMFASSSPRSRSRPPASPWSACGSVRVRPDRSAPARSFLAASRWPRDSRKPGRQSGSLPLRCSAR